MSPKYGLIGLTLLALSALGAEALAQSQRTGEGRTANRETWRANVIVSLTDPAEGAVWVVERLSLTQWQSSEACERLKAGSGAGRRMIRNVQNLGSWRTASGEPPTIELVDLVCTQVR
jgi:hypothetical protein